MQFLTAQQIIGIHNRVIRPHERQGRALQKSIESVIARVETRVAYGLIENVFELAACYAVHITVAHAFNDANKRTAFAAMHTVLKLNGIELTYTAEEAGDMIRKAAQRRTDEQDVSQWLRMCAQ